MNAHVTVTRESIEKDQKRIAELEEKLKKAEKNSVSSKITPPLPQYALLEKENEYLKQEVRVLQDQLRYQGMYVPTHQESPDTSDDNILYNIKLDFEYDVMRCCTRVCLSGVNEKGEVYRIQTNMEKTTNSIQIPNVIMGIEK